MWLNSNTAQAEGVSTAVADEYEADADLRELVYELITDMDTVRDGESWELWMEQYRHVAELLGTENLDALAFGQVVPVPDSPADWAYVDWEDVPYAMRPSFALAHACGVMTGRYYEGENVLRWDPEAPLTRGEVANVAARLLEINLEIMLESATYSRPGCPLAAELFRGDPEMFMDLLGRLESRHEAAVEELTEALRILRTRVDELDAEVFERLEAELELRLRMQTRLDEIAEEAQERYVELADEVGALWIVLDELEEKVQALKLEIYDAVVAYCEANEDCRGPQGPQGPRGVQGPPGRDADYDAVRAEFDALLEGFVTQEEFEADQARQDVVLADHERRIRALEDRFDVTVDYCPAWVNFTGNRGVGEFDEDNPYRRGMEVSANAGLNADVAASGKVWIVSYHLPGHDPIRPNDRAEWKVSGFYESLSPGAVVAITLSDGEDTCTVSTTLVGL